MQDIEADEAEDRACTPGKPLMPVMCPSCPARFIGAGRRDRRWKHMIEEGHVPVSWTAPAKFLMMAERFVVGGPALNTTREAANG
jgi:hypothetical protein